MEIPFDKRRTSQWKGYTYSSLREAALSRGLWSLSASSSFPCIKLVPRTARLASDLWYVGTGAELSLFGGGFCLCFIEVLSMPLFSFSMAFPHSSHPLVCSSRSSIRNWCLFLPLTGNLKSVVVSKCWMSKNAECLGSCDDICPVVDFEIFCKGCIERFGPCSHHCPATLKAPARKVVFSPLLHEKTKTHKG